MSSLIPGYEYDIFISYRQKDNKYDGWVTAFVANLKKELEATFKEDISIYFDENPHDGLLETHVVDKSLERKLKCLVFIPIISQTYCDPKSFAWQSELCVFNKAAKEDLLGREINLASGNVGSRILPVRIHDLDEEDRSLLESELEGWLRGVEFIYKEAGVNRPLKPTDSKSDNQNKTDYRNQVNKVANAIKETVQGIRKPMPRNQGTTAPARTVNTKQSLLVLPFVNISSDPDQEYFSDGLTEEIITELALVGKLTVISRSSAMTFKGTKKKIAEIAEEAGADFVLEGSVRKAGKNLRITAQLINPQDDSHLWSERYSGELDDIFGIQEKVSRSILQALKLKLSKEDNERIARRPIENAQAYELFLKAQYEFYTFKEEALLRSIQYLEKALEIVGENTLLYGAIGLAYWNLYNVAGTAEVNYLEKVEPVVRKIFDLDPGSPHGHRLSGMLALFTGTKTEMLMHLERANSGQPHDSVTLLMLGLTYFYTGEAAKGEKVIRELGQIDLYNPIYPVIMSLTCSTKGDIRSALDWSKEAYEKNPEVPQAQLYYAYFLACLDHREQSYLVLDRLIAESDGTMFGSLGKFFKYALQGEKPKAIDLLTAEIIAKLKQDCESSWVVADSYALMNETEEALDWLELTIKSGFINYPLFSQFDPFLESVRGESRYKELMSRAKTEWENFPRGTT